LLGRTIGRYEILERIGGGGMGVVYKARDVSLDRFVALKFISPEVSADPDARERFIREAKAASGLDHPQICTIHEISTTDQGELFIAMSFVGGRDLKEVMARQGPMTRAAAADIALQIARGLARAHEQGIIHRDIKPANIILTDRGEVKIVDFGLAKLAGSASITRPDSTVGTLGYMAPEQIRGVTADERSDVWSVTVVLYEMLTGRNPFVGENAGATIHAVLNFEPPPAGSFDGVIRRGLAKDPSRRYPNMAAFIADLQNDSGDRTAVREAVPAGPSIAVLPFSDYSPQRDQEYFCEGIAEEILNVLTKIPELRVASRTSSFRFREASADIRSIGGELNVTAVLEGSVRKAGNRIRVTAQLIDVSSGFHLWSERYDRDLEDIFAIQDEIAASIASALQVTLADKDQRSMRESSPAEIEAYEYYLRGRQLMLQHRKAAYAGATEMYRKALAIDPNYTRAWAALSDVSSISYMYTGQEEAMLRLAEEASSKAIELDPTLAEAQVARGMALTLYKDFAGAERHFQEALRINPNSFDANYYFGRARWAEGRPNDAIALYQRAAELQPDQYDVQGMLVEMLRSAGREEEALAATERARQATERYLQLFPSDARALCYMAGVLAHLQRVQESDVWIQRALEVGEGESTVHYNLACVYAYRQEQEKALQQLDRAIDSGFFHREWIENDPDLAAVRTHPGYPKVIGRLK
jgi:serine/threonine protein kinase/Flp pilus assembly protein TadD